MIYCNHTQCNAISWSRAGRVAPAAHQAPACSAANNNDNDNNDNNNANNDNTNHNNNNTTNKHDNTINNINSNNM